MASIQIVYGSNGGNTELVCEYVAATLQDLGHDVKLDRCEHFPEDQLTARDLLVLACPTYEHGQLEDHFRISFWPRIQALDLTNQKCAVIGLGHYKYDTDYHLESARILQQFVEDRGGKCIVSNCLVSGSPVRFLSNVVQRWCERLDAALKS